MNVVAKKKKGVPVSRGYLEKQIPNVPHLSTARAKKVFSDAATLNIPQLGCYPTERTDGRRLALWAGKSAGELPAATTIILKASAEDSTITSGRTRVTVQGLNTGLTLCRD